MTAVKKAPRDSTTAECAFCKGEGKDPFGLLSPRAVCQVCCGKRVVTVIEPAIKCAFCKGSGLFHPGKRLTCTVCGGKGMVTVMGPSGECARCKGRGVIHGSDYLPCTSCKGKGLVQGLALNSKRDPERSQGWVGARAGVTQHVFAIDNKGLRTI